MLLVLLPDKRFNVKQLLDHDFLTNSGSYISGGSLGENCTILRQLLEQEQQGKNHTH